MYIHATHNECSCFLIFCLRDTHIIFLKNVDIIRCLSFADVQTGAIEYAAMLVWLVC